MSNIDQSLGPNKSIAFEVTKLLTCNFPSEVSAMLHST